MKKRSELSTNKQEGMKCRSSSTEEKGPSFQHQENEKRKKTEKKKKMNKGNR